MDIEAITWIHPETGLVYRAEERKCYQKRVTFFQASAGQPIEYLLFVPAGWGGQNLHGTYSSIEDAKAAAENYHELYGAGVHEYRQKEEKRAKERKIALLKQELFELENG